jgi:hypothetical protein
MPSSGQQGTDFTFAATLRAKNRKVPISANRAVFGKRPGRDGTSIKS